MIYLPEKDSYLLSDVLKKQIKNKNITCLEIGIGSGIQLQTLKKLKIKNIFGVDINLQAVQHCKKLGFNCIQSNLFEKIKDKYDLIIFNPPYLPENKKEPKNSRLATTGGKKGSEIINKFLKQAKKHLNKDGKIFLVTSSLTKGIKWNSFKKKKIASQKLFFEELYVWELTI
jgi:release factor glutamine methyltransferase